ncbi:MAG TPA: Na(+)-translocating NADH-quinone reductase subunit A [Bacteroidales bacterium]|nr:Na(+)-translocating NADH-quinone reductase subunit A [Bacteroidales bacterium]
MSNHIRLRRGLNIPLKGKASNQITKNISSNIVAVKPSDFRNFSPKLLVKEGDAVLAGSPVLADKKNLSIRLCSPVSGTVKEIVRGEKRKLLAVLIENDHKNEHLQFTTLSKNAKKEEIIERLLEGGLWPTIKQRPYGIIPNPGVEPKSIFISGFDSSPLAPDLDFTLKRETEAIQAGIDVLNLLTKGGIHFSLNIDNFAGSPFHRIERVIFHTFEGPHPAGNVGIQINHVDPINKGDIVWTTDLYSLAAIGKLFTRGIYDVKRIIAITGPRCINPSYVECLPGMCMSDIKEYSDENSEVKNNNLPVRWISGNVLTGVNVGANGYTGFFHNQVTLISEGNYYEMLGWIKPFRSKKFSISRTYFSWLNCKKQYELDTNTNGDERAFVMTGVYEKVLPMDIYPTYLLKAILAEDIDNMEALGIYEVIEEDFALCEFVCPSKIKIQEIISKGIDLMLKEMA